MPTARKLLAGLALAITAISCSDDRSPTSPAAPDNQAPAAKVTQSAALLTDMAASGPTVYDANLLLHPNNPQGSAGPLFRGTVTISHFDYVDGKLLVDGVVKDANGTVIKTFTDVEATLKRGRGAPTQPTCQILDLDIGAIHLDLLGLVVDLAPIHLDITAESGAGNLLGNLLCALAGLLNGPNIGGLIGAITDLLNQINAILMGL
jgi:hypothetical protein